MTDEMNLTKYEWNLLIRNMTLDDFDALVAMQLNCFPGMKPWGREQIESQLQRFPEAAIPAL